MDAIESLGILFKAASDAANRTRLTNSSITKVLRGSIMGKTGLKSTPTERNAIAHKYLPRLVMSNAAMELLS